MDVIDPNHILILKISAIASGERRSITTTVFFFLQETFHRFFLFLNKGGIEYVLVALRFPSLRQDQDALTIDFTLQQQQQHQQI